MSESTPQLKELWAGLAIRPWRTDAKPKITVCGEVARFVRFSRAHAIWIRSTMGGLPIHPMKTFAAMESIMANWQLFADSGLTASTGR